MMKTTISGAPMWMKASSVNRRLVDAAFVEEIADQRAVEHGQNVEPFSRGNDDKLRQLVPHQHEAVDAGHIDQPQQCDAGQP